MSPKRGAIAILGANGQLGSDLCLAFQAEELLPLNHADVDVSDADGVYELLRAAKPAVVINTAAYHHTTHCEEHPERAFQVNALGPLHLARACEEIDALLVHVSTDYVFDGAKRAPYLESDATSPLNVYGISKLAGESAVLRSCERHYVVRSSGLYGVATCRAKGENFATKMLRLARERGRVSVVSDEIVTPTWTGSLARQIRRLCRSEDVPYGIVHATDHGECSWYEFAAEVFRLSQVAVKLDSASVDDFPSPVKRPFYSVLENRALLDAGADELQDWQESLARYLELESAPG